MSESNAHHTFNVVDVETANADRSSICQIGLVQVVNGEIRAPWETKINPEEWFDPRNVKIHRITEDDVAGAPTYPDVHAALFELVHGSVLVSYSAFDRVSLSRTIEKYNLSQVNVTWLDCARVVRRTWPERYGKKGWALKRVAADLGIRFNHHDAGEDATATAKVMLAAIKSTGCDIECWLRRVEGPIDEENRRPGRGKSPSIRQVGDPDGPFFGETIVFTGALNLPRKDAAKLAAEKGFTVGGSVTKKTTVLVVGIHPNRRARAYSKSKKHLDAEALIDAGQEIEILSETDFMALVRAERSRSNRPES